MHDIFLIGNAMDALSEALPFILKAMGALVLWFACCGSACLSVHCALPHHRPRATAHL